MDDLVTRLHDAKPPHHRKCLQAADEIEVLRAELARVRACLERIERFGTGFYCPLWGSEECDWECPNGGMG